MYIWSAIALDQMAKKHGLFLYHIENNRVHGVVLDIFFVMTINLKDQLNAISI